ncbi:MAG: DUF5698 domain-containing protein [Candidatus Woesearchaeota archaeon]
MDFTAFLAQVYAFDFYTWLLIPLLIFFARIIDVSMGTIRMIFIARGLKFLAPLLGFFEVIIWLMAIRQILLNLSNVMSYIAYGAGFAAGTYIGIVLEERLAVGRVAVRVVASKDASKLASALDKEGFTGSVSKADGPSGKVKIIFVVIERVDIWKMVELIKQYNPDAFYSVEDVRFVNKEVFSNGYHHKKPSMLNFHRKGK